MIWWVEIISNNFLTDLKFVQPLKCDYDAFVYYIELNDYLCRSGLQSGGESGDIPDRGSGVLCTDRDSR